jgi:CheY-like chemotaxis protein
VAALGSPARILVIEDDGRARSALAALLIEEGFDVAQAGNGAEALAALAQPPVVALVDYRLPDIDGVSLIRAIRERVSGCRCIMVTGSADLHIADDGEASFSDREAEALDAGAAGYLAKPVDLAALLQLMNRLLG